jgi:hypothetical protein
MIPKTMQLLGITLSEAALSSGVIVSGPGATLRSAPRKAVQRLISATKFGASSSGYAMEERRNKAAAVACDD